MKRIEDEVQARTVESRLRQLFVRGLAGDARAYHEFLKDLSGHLRAFLRKRLFRLPDDVEYPCKNRCSQSIPSATPIGKDQPLTAWVHAIARYKLVDLLRQRGGRESLNDPLDDELEVFAASAAEAADARRDLGKLLETLPDRQRLPIVYMKLEGLSVVETARLTGMSESAVKVGVHRGLKALAAKMRGDA